MSGKPGKRTRSLSEARNRLSTNCSTNTNCLDTSASSGRSTSGACPLIKWPRPSNCWGPRSPRWCAVRWPKSVQHERCSVEQVGSIFTRANFASREGNQEFLTAREEFGGARQGKELLFLGQ